LFAAEATLHYKDYETGEFKSFSIPESVRPFVKPYHYCKLDGMYHFPPHRNDEVGVVIGQGDTIKESIENLQEHLEALKDEPVFANTEGFAELLQSVEEAEKQGMEFTDQEIPDPAIVLETQ
jgi:biotin carboxylase